MNDGAAGLIKKLDVRREHDPSPSGRPVSRRRLSWPATIYSKLTAGREHCGLAVSRP